MARIYRVTDRIVVKIDDVTVKLAPLTLHQKTEVQMALLQGSKSGDIREATRGMALAMKYSVKGIDGVEDSDGQPYKLDLGDTLSDQCVDDLMNLEITNKLALACLALVNGIPKQFTDPKNNPLDGVEIINSEGKPSEGKI